MGGWYYWHANYWYPAWGYHPDAVYAYDGPIYAYNDLAPDQAVANVQTTLEQLGYYHGPINGYLDSGTREAISNFQRDHGLYATSTIDEPTLASLEWPKRVARLKYWEIIADNLKKRGWSLGYVSVIDSNGRTIWIADAHRDDGKRLV